MDWHEVASLGFIFVEEIGHLLHRFVMASICACADCSASHFNDQGETRHTPKNDIYSNGILVDVLHGLFGIKPVLTLDRDGNEPALDLEVASEFLQGDLCVGSHDDVRALMRRLSIARRLQPKSTYPGSWMLLPAALRFACQMRFIASPPSWIASEDPVVAVPMACLADGACHKSARIETPLNDISESSGL